MEVMGMCGILGIVGGNIDIRSFLACLGALSTRGQEATGITGFSSGFISNKCEGTVTNLKTQLSDHSERIKIGIGSTRYPTIGSMNKESIHKHLAPFTESTKKGVLSLAFNGNIVFPPVEEENNDGALLTRLLKEELEKKHITYKAVQDLMSVIDGAYSTVAMLGDDQLIAFRDPYGIRPLSWGFLDGGGFAVASESRVLEKLGIDDFQSLPPGGLMIFNSDSYEKHRIFYERTSYCMFEWTYFSQATSISEGKEVYQVRYNLGCEIGGLLKKKGITNADYVIPVPNTAKTAANGCANFLDLKYADGLIKGSSGRIFIKPTKEEREFAVKDVYEPVRSVISGKNLILIDDSIVRGTTLKRVISLLRQKGARRIHVGITTPMIKYPCLYGIDMTRQENC